MLNFALNLCSYRAYWLTYIYYFTNICTNKYYKINIETTASCFGEYSQSSGSCVNKSCELLNDKILYKSALQWKILVNVVANATPVYVCAVLWFLFTADQHTTHT
jgi:hypothetical protein